MSTIRLSCDLRSVRQSGPAYAGTPFLKHHGDDVSAPGAGRTGSRRTRYLIIAVLPSCLGTTQTSAPGSILPTARTTM